MNLPIKPAYTLDEIAAAFGKSPRTARRWCLRNGVPIRRGEVLLADLDERMRPWMDSLRRARELAGD